MKTNRLMAVASGLVVFVGSQTSADPVEKATNALRLLGYATARVSLCDRLVPREWACLVSTSNVDARASWVHFHRADDGTFVVRARRAGALALPP
jgi:hypothetical protein